MVDFQDNEFMDIDTPVEIEAAKPEKPAGRVKRGKKKIANQEPLSHQTPHRHAPAMLSAHTADEDQSESEKPVSQPLVVAALGRNKKQVHYDQHGVYIPKEGRKGPQREEPNNRAVIKPWFNFEQGEIGMKSYPSELKEPNRPHFPSGNLHVDQARGQYNLDNTADEFDQKLIATFKLHPTMGLPIPGSVNPDDAFPRTDYDAVLKHTPKPFVQPDAKRPEGVSVSKSYDFINTERRWNNLEVRLKMGQYGHLKEQYGQSGLATYDPQAKDVSAAQYAVEDMLEAAEELERQEREPSKLAKSASPSPIRKSARVKEKALKAQMSKSPAPLPVTPPPRPPPILSTAQLSCLADAAEIRRHEDYRHSMEPSTIYERTILPQPQPPQNAPPRPHSQMPHLAFITNPAPAPGLNEIRPIAPQPQRPLPLHPAPQQQLLPGPPPPQQPQRSYGPVMMGPPPPGTYMPYPMQSHPPGIFYGSPAHSHASPPPPQPAPHPSQAKRPLRPGPNLRSLLPRSMHGDPVGPPQGPLHGHPQTQSPIYYGGGPPPNYQQQYERHYEGPGGAAPGPLGAPHAGPGGHHSPYRSEPYGPGPQAHYQGPGGPSQPPNGYFPFQHHDMRRR